MRVQLPDDVRHGVRCSPPSMARAARLAGAPDTPPAHRRPLRGPEAALRQESGQVRKAAEPGLSSGNGASFVPQWQPAHVNLSRQHPPSPPRLRGARPDVRESSAGNAGTGAALRIMPKTCAPSEEVDAGVRRPAVRFIVTHCARTRPAGTQKVCTVT